MIFDGMTLEEVFAQIGLEPDVRVEGHPDLRCAAAHARSIGIRKKGGIVFNHRSSAEREIYFVSNTREEAVDFTVSLRACGRQPWLWNAVNGSVTKAAAFTQADGRTRIPLRLEATESVVLVLEGPIGADTKGGQPHNMPDLEPIADIKGPWTVRFNGQGAPAETAFPDLTDWSNNPDESIRHYAGSAVYESKITLADSPAQGERVLLELGQAAIMATVTINGEEAGTLWCPPWRIDVSDHLQVGENRLEIRVVNTWHNRLTADARKPQSERQSHISQPYRIKPGTPLASGGLLGPVRLVAEPCFFKP